MACLFWPPSTNVSQTIHNLSLSLSFSHGCQKLKIVNKTLNPAWRQTLSKERSTYLKKLTLFHSHPYEDTSGKHTYLSSSHMTTSLCECRSDYFDKSWNMHYYSMEARQIILSLAPLVTKEYVFLTWTLQLLWSVFILSRTKIYLLPLNRIHSSLGAENLHCVPWVYMNHWLSKTQLHPIQLMAFDSWDAATMWSELKISYNTTQQFYVWLKRWSCLSPVHPSARSE